MVNPSEIVDALVELLRGVGAFVSEMGGDPERIYAYHYNFSNSKTVQEAIDDMEEPSAMLRWVQSAPSEFGEIGGGFYWQHTLELVLRAGAVADGDSPRLGLGRLVGQLFSGDLLVTEFHDDCEPLHALIDRLSVEPGEDSQGVSILKVSIPVTERSTS